MCSNDQGAMRAECSMGSGILRALQGQQGRTLQAELSHHPSQAAGQPGTAQPWA